MPQHRDAGPVKCQKVLITNKATSGGPPLYLKFTMYINILYILLTPNCVFLDNLQKNA